MRGHDTAGPAHNAPAPAALSSFQVLLAMAKGTSWTLFLYKDTQWTMVIASGRTPTMGWGHHGTGEWGTSRGCPVLRRVRRWPGWPCPQSHAGWASTAASRGTTSPSLALGPPTPCVWQTLATWASQGTEPSALTSLWLPMAVPTMVRQ